MQTKETESILLMDISHGDTKAFERLFMLYFPKLKLFLAGFLDREEEAEDLAQDVFVKVWQNRSSLGKIENLNAYLYRMAKNALYTYLDRSFFPDALPASGSGYIPSSEELEEIIFAQELEELMGVAIDKMPPKRKAIFCMSRLLKPDEMVSLSNGNLIKTTAVFNNEEYLKSGIFSFNNKKFSEILNYLTLWYDVKFRIQSSARTDRYVSGKFRQSDEIERILKALQGVHPFRYKILNKEEIEIY